MRNQDGRKQASITAMLLSACVPVVAALAVVCIAPPADAVDAATLIGPDLKPQPIMLHSVHDGMITYFDPSRRLHTEKLDQYLQLRIVNEAKTPDLDRQAPSTAAAQPQATDASTKQDVKARPVTVTLTDGQQIGGNWRADGKAEHIGVKHPSIGAIDISLERTRAIRFDDATPSASDSATGDDDRITLANGDVVKGFVASVGNERIRIETAGDRKVDLAVEHVASIQLANPVNNKPTNDTRVTLRDGSRLLVEAFAIERGKATLKPRLTAGREASIALDHVAAINLHSSLGRLTPLFDVPFDAKTESVFGVKFAPRIKSDAAYLHAPTKLNIKLPEGSARLALRIALDDEASSDEARQWADCVAIIRQGDKPLQRVRLNASQPVHDINIAVTPGGLSIELDPGINGPVMDRVIISNAILFVRDVKSK